MPYQYIKEPEHLKHFVSKTTPPPKNPNVTVKLWINLFQCVTVCLLHKSKNLYKNNWTGLSGLKFMLLESC